VAVIALLGLGFGSTMNAVLLGLQTHARRDDLGVATSSITYFRALGSATGTAVLGAVLSAGLVGRRPSPQQVATTLHNVYVVALIVAVACLGCAIVLAHRLRLISLDPPEATADSALVNA